MAEQMKSDSIKTIDPELPVPKSLMRLTYISVTGASIAIIIAMLIHLLRCGCGC
jgi:hypothetical protein